MVTTLENKRVGYIDKSEAAQLAIEMDNENKELAVKGFKLTPLARIVDCLCWISINCVCENCAHE